MILENICFPLLTLSQLSKGPLQSPYTTFLSSLIGSLIVGRLSYEFSYLKYLNSNVFTFPNTKLKPFVFICFKLSSYSERDLNFLSLIESSFSFTNSKTKCPLELYFFYTSFYLVRKFVRKAKSPVALLKANQVDFV